MTGTIALQRTRWGFPSAVAATAFRWLHAALSFPEYLFLATLVAMLFRPPDLKVFPLDRVALGVLVAVWAGRRLLLRQPIRIPPPVWPLAGLVGLSLIALLHHPFSAPAWSVLGAQWIVPLVFLQIAGDVFSNESSIRKLEWFSIVLLLYLSAISVFALLGWKALIFPRFILDEGLGIHFDRARGPFLQAVANGLCLTVLALVALHSYQRGRLRGLLALSLAGLVPIAVLATKTRAVWLSAILSLAVLAFLRFDRRLRRVAVFLLIIAAGALAANGLWRVGSGEMNTRLGERSPVEFRAEMYRAGWQMFLEKPLFGWGGDAEIQPEIAKRVSNFRPEYFIFHNTYLEIAVRYGVVGVSLYGWLLWSLLRLGLRRSFVPETGSFLDGSFNPIWLVIMSAYLLNASVVVMNYQFPNAYLYGLAGVLAARQSRLLHGKELDVGAAA